MMYVWPRNLPQRYYFFFFLKVISIMSSLWLMWEPIVLPFFFPIWMCCSVVLCLISSEHNITLSVFLCLANKIHLFSRLLEFKSRVSISLITRAALHVKPKILKSQRETCAAACVCAGDWVFLLLSLSVSVTVASWDVNSSPPRCCHASTSSVCTRETKTYWC